MREDSLKCVWFSVFPDELELGCNPQLRSNISVVLWFQGLPQGFVFIKVWFQGFHTLAGVVSGECSTPMFLYDCGFRVSTEYPCC